MKTIWIIVVCILGCSYSVAQKNKFKLPIGITPADYESGAVWVKVKTSHKNMFVITQAGARVPSQIHASYVKPLFPIGSRNKSAARLAPRNLQVDLSRYYKLSFDKGYPLEDYINDLYATGYFEKVEPAYVEHALFTPNDPAISSQYYLNLIKAKEAWDITQGSSSLVIGIVDSGGDLNHPDLQNNIYLDPADPTDGIDNDGDGYIDNNRGWDFSGADISLIGTPGFQGDNNPTVYSGNRFGHGTMVAGCASASTNDAIGISGVGFNTKLLFTKHYADNQPDNATSYSSNLYEGVLYAALHGAKIINCSWGNPNASGLAQDIISFVTLDLGCLVVAAAGNSNSESPLYPAAYEHVLSVASSDENDLRSWFSNYGKTVDIIAPGSNIYTTNYDNAYRMDSGTSLSAPIVAGAAALVWAHNPTFTALQVAEQLRISADETFYVDNAAYLHKLGRGRLDLLKALTIQSPSIRASNQILINYAGETPGPGESAKLTFDFTNFLRPSSSGLTIALSSLSPFLTITQNQFSPGAMGSNHTVSNTSRPFELTFASNLSIDQTVEALLTFTDGSYHDTQLINFVMPSFIDVNENNITTTITSSGRIGYANSQSQNNGSGFVYNDESLLFEMGVIMGTSSAMVFDNVRGVGGAYNQDFYSASKIKKLTPGERSYSEVTGFFRNAATEGSESLLISYRSLVWKEDPYRNFIILEYKIKNTTSSPLSDFFMGIFADWDILAGGSSDRASWDNDTRMGYVFPAQPSMLPRAGIQALNSEANYYAIDNDQTVPGNPFGIHDGFTDIEKYRALSSGLVKTQAGGSSGGDVSQVVSAGPYTINGGSEITIAFALHGAQSLAEIINSARYADSVYNYTFRATKPLAANVESCEGSDVLLRADGATKFNWYKDFVGGVPIFSGPEFTIPHLANDTAFFVSNADKSYESLRTSVSVSVRLTPTIDPLGDLTFCEGQNVTLLASNGNEYAWSTDATTQTIQVTTAGSYTVDVRSGMLSCRSLPTRVIVHPKPSSEFVVSNQEVSGGYEAMFTNQSVGAAEYEWDFGDGQISTAENPQHHYSMMGNYTITLTAISDKGCESTESKSIGIITGIEPPLESTISLHPNPVYTGTIVMNRKANSDPVVLEIFDAKGQLVYEWSITSDDLQHSVDLSAFGAGLYQFRITSRDQTFTTKILVVR